MKHLGLVTDRENKHLSASDRLLIEPLKMYGFEAEPVVWEDKKTDWQKFDLVILRSCWNYYKKYEEWLEWLDGLMAKKIKVLNPIEIVKWNSHKSYLLDLERRGIKIVPTRIVQAGESIQGENLIIKPTIGAASHGVRLINGVTSIKQESILQPKINEIEDGEISLVFFNKIFQFGVNKKPNKGDYRTHPNFGGKEKIVEIHDDIRVSTIKILDLIPSPLLYARVDGVMKDEQFLLMELELIEPHLFFDLYPMATEGFAKAAYELS